MASDKRDERADPNPESKKKQNRKDQKDKFELGVGK